MKARLTTLAVTVAIILSALAADWDGPPWP
jgi:hypothetical protein